MRHDTFAGTSEDDYVAVTLNMYNFHKFSMQLINTGETNDLTYKVTSTFAPGSDYEYEEVAAANVTPGNSVQLELPAATKVALLRSEIKIYVKSKTVETPTNYLIEHISAR